MEKKIKRCFYCKKRVKLDQEKYVLLGTYDKKKVMDESYFHWQCFNEWYHSRVAEKSMNTIKGVGKMVTGLMKGVQQMALARGGNEDLVDEGFEYETVEEKPKCKKKRKKK